LIPIVVEHHLLSYKNSQISYYLYGSGHKIAICFHGYGEDASGFSFLKKHAGDEYTFYAVDLPYHGQTEWNAEDDFQRESLWDIIIKITNSPSDRFIPVRTGTGGRAGKFLIPDSKITLIGFSLGGRIALSLYEAMPQQVEKMILLAPDGLKINFWYWLATQTWMGNKFFMYTMKRPGWVFVLLRGLNKLKLVNTSIFKFVNHYIGDKNVREELYKRWTSLRRLRPDLKKIKSHIKTNKTLVRLLYGKHDRIILPVRGEKFRRGIENFCVLRIIHSGHQVLHEKHAEEIVECLMF